MGNVTEAPLELAGQAETDIAQFFSDARRDANEQVFQYQRQAGQVAEDVIGLTQDFSRGGLKTLNNVQDNLLFSGRFVAGNVVALIDNQMDNVFDVVDSARTDLSSSIQMFALITGTGMLAMFILYGDKIMQKGISLGEISLF